MWREPRGNALVVYENVQASGQRPTVHVIVSALKACTESLDLQTGRRIHQHLSIDHTLDVFVASTLVDMYCKCGSLVEARRVFDGMESRNVVSWNCLIRGYAENGEGELALQLYQRMQHEGICAPNFVTYLAAIKACLKSSEKNQRCSAGDAELLNRKCLETAKAIHLKAAGEAGGLHTFVGNALIDLYSRLGCLSDARNVFESISHRTVVSWTAMIQGYAEYGEGERALELYDGMDCEPNRVTFLAALKACVALAGSGRESLKKGREIHAQASRRGCEKNAFVASMVVEMYVKCGSMSEARSVFDRMEHRDLVSWTGIISGYAQQGEGEMALHMFSRMREQGGVTPDAVTYTAALNACSRLADKESGELVNGKLVKLRGVCSGKRVHQEILTTRGEPGNVPLSNALIDMYSKCGSMLDAQLVFDGMEARDTVSWNCLISGYVHAGESDFGLKLYHTMQDGGWKPDGITLVAALRACASLCERDEARKSSVLLEEGRAIHNAAAKEHLEDLFVLSALVEMYAKCGSLEASLQVFESMRHKDLVSWNCIISGYAAQDGEEELALELYERMKQDGFKPNEVSCLAALRACSGLCATEEGKMMKPRSLERTRAVHSDARKAGVGQHLFVATSLVDVYSRCGSMSDASAVFERMEVRTIVSWTAITQGYADSPQPALALEYYERMKSQGECRADGFMFAALLKACGSTGALETGRMIEAEIRNVGLHRQTVVVNSLVDFYGKCGRMLVAEERFESAGERRSSVTWNSLIDGYGRQGDAEQALLVFERMKKEQVEVNDVTFLCLLTACSHAGLVEKGKTVYEEMSRVHGLEPGVKHYGVMVDLLGRANKLEEALKLAYELPKKNKKIWMILLDVCNKYKNVQVAKLCFDMILRDGDEELVASACVLFSNACR